MTDSKTYAVFERIRLMMKDEGISQYALCQELNIVAQVFTQWSRGTSHSYIKHLKKIAATLNVTEDYLLTGEPAFDDIMPPPRRKCVSESEAQAVFDRIMLVTKKKGFTQTEICHGLGLTRNAISIWKEGKTRSFMKYTKKVAEILGVTEEYLLTGEPKPDLPEVGDDSVLAVRGANARVMLKSEARVVLDRIILVMKRRGINQRVLCQKVKEPEPVFTLWKNGASYTFIYHTKQIADILNVEESYLLTGEPRIDPTKLKSFGGRSVIPKDEAYAILNRIILVMEKRGMCQAALCEGLNLDYATFPHWKERKGWSYIRYIKRIAAFLGVDEEYLLAGEPEPNWEKLPPYIRAKTKPKPDPAPVLNRIVFIMKAKGIRQSEVCRKTGLNPSIFSSWLRGASHSYVKYTKAIAAVIGVEESYLLTGEPAPDGIPRS